MSVGKIGRYEIISELGRGGMAVVYLARDPLMKREVAVKVLPRQFTFSEQFRARFRREAEVIAALEHPNVVPIYDFGEHDDLPYIVMRYMPGGSLAERIGQAPFSLKDTIAILERIGSALDDAHNRGIIHRDLKPSNILFGKHDDPYLADFGIVKVIEGTAQLTGSGIVGTPLYMAPELSENAAVMPSVDIYALGVTLFQMLTGKVPYNAETPMGILMAHISRPIPDARNLRGDLPEGIQMVIEQAMAKDPAMRYQTAGAIVDDLKTISAGEPVPSLSPQTISTDMPINLSIDAPVHAPQMPQQGTMRPSPTGPAAKRRPGRKLPIIAILGGIGGALVCLVLLAGLGYAVLDGRLSGFGQPTPTMIPTATATSTPTLSPSAFPTPSLSPGPTLVPTNTIEPVQVSPLCSYYGHPTVYVEAGRPVMLAWTWNAKWEHLVEEHIEAATYRILLDSDEVEAVRRSEIEYVAAKGWYSVTWYADPVMLEAGTHLAERYLSWSRMISDGWSTYGPGGDKETEHDTCTIIIQ
ncbi:MAG: serine/threonine protein kinase [Anaerolineae bacterium]|nr:serine/threonine protein kinase [Anaerolineae bacterium]